MNKLTCGVGVNDLGYRVHVREEVTKNGGKRIRKSVFRCKYYAVWKHMLERCYSKKFLESNQTYIDASVCSEWLYASEFKKWMEQQDWRGKSYTYTRTLVTGKGLAYIQKRLHGLQAGVSREVV